MVSIGPYTQAYDMKQMYNLPDLRSKTKQDCQFPDNSLMGIINSNSDFTIFSQIVKKAKYESKLSDKQADFTIFVPSDTQLKQQYSKQFLDNIDIGFAQQILKFSMMNRKLDKGLLQSSPASTFPTIDRSNLMTISTVSEKTMLPNCTTVIHWNYPASNGLIHVIDNLLIPDNSIFGNPNFSMI